MRSAVASSSSSSTPNRDDSSCVSQYPLRGAGEEVPVLREAAPDLARVDRCDSVEHHLPELDASRVQQPRDVVVASDQQLGGVAERLVVEEKPGST